MLPLYLAAAAFGLVLVTLSLIAGALGHVASGDAGGQIEGPGKPDLPPTDAPAEPDTGIMAPGKPDMAIPHLKGELSLYSAFIPLTSVRFWTYASFTFGGVGAILELAGAPGVVGLASAIGTGLGFGWVAAWLFRRIMRDNVTGETDLAGLVGKEATVVIAVRRDRRGKVAIEGPGGRLEVPATTRDPADLPRGARVLITSVREGTADVTALLPDKP